MKLIEQFSENTSRQIILDRLLLELDDGTTVNLNFFIKVILDEITSMKSDLLKLKRAADENQ